MVQDSPKLFMSYCWSSPEHGDWVLKLATEIRENGVDVILDKWDLKEGNDALAFMEKMVADPDVRKVVMVCDRRYKEKADERSGGVGIEAQIISPEIYNKADQNKFVAVVSERDADGHAFLPIYYGSRMYIDLSDEDLYATNFDQLLRWIYDKPFYSKPPLGKQPVFLSEDDAIHFGTTARYKRALDAIRNGRGTAKGALDEYLQIFADEVEKFRISPDGREIDDLVVENIDNFLPHRNEMIQIFLAIAQYHNTPEAWQQLHSFFEKIMHYTDRSGYGIDNFNFIVHELFLYAVASLLSYRCFDAVAYLVRNHYYDERKIEYGNPMVSFTAFSQDVKSLDMRKQRLKMPRLSLRADLLEQRSSASGISFVQLMQADFVLYIKSCFDRKNGTSGKSLYWWPETLVYDERHAGPFEIFARARSKTYFENIKCLFDIRDKEDFVSLVDSFSNGELELPRWPFKSIDPGMLLGIEKLATMP